MSQESGGDGSQGNGGNGAGSRAPVKRSRFVIGAVFLMATSSIGPAFLTQTAVFTERFLASFAFAILASIVIDIGAQLNVWRIIAVSKMRGQDVANAVLPKLGSVIAVMVFVGGLAFNIGNVAGAGLGMNVLFGIEPALGALIAGAVTIAIFLIRQAGQAMDAMVGVLGALMLVMVAYVTFTSNPPLGEAAVRSVYPEGLGGLLFPIITLVGGTVGGYITFAGGHRLLDAGVSGVENLRYVNTAAVTGILVTGVMRVFLFLAILGVVAAGNSLNPDNPPASAFQIALGNIGFKFFGVVLMAAALTSIIGASYTSVSFIRSFHPLLRRYNNYVIVLFILFCTTVFVLAGEPPVGILVAAGALNGLILPVVLGALLLGSRNRRIVGEGYRHPTWMIVWGVLAVLITAAAAYFSIQEIGSIL